MERICIRRNCYTERWKGLSLTPLPLQFLFHLPSLLSFPFFLSSLSSLSPILLHLLALIFLFFICPLPFLSPLLLVSSLLIEYLSSLCKMQGWEKELSHIQRDHKGTTKSIIKYTSHTTSISIHFWISFPSNSIFPSNGTKFQFNAPSSCLLSFHHFTLYSIRVPSISTSFLLNGI